MSSLVPSAVVEAASSSLHSSAQQLQQLLAPDQEDPCAIGKWFEQQLRQSFDAHAAEVPSLSAKVESPTPTAPSVLLHRFQLLRADAKTQADRLWTELVCALLPATEDIAGQALQLVGLWPKLLPAALLPHLARTDVIGASITAAAVLTDELRAVLGAVCVARCQQQQMERCIRLLSAGQTEAALSDAAHVGCSNWNPRGYPEWLLFELEQDLTIREVQVTVATRMIDAPSSSLLQLNMGMGKSAVIVPMLCATLANGKQLARVTVLRSLFPTNHASLVQKLGGLLYKRVFETPCSRDMELNFGHVRSLEQLLAQCMSERGVVLTTPEYRLSFELMTFDSCRKKSSSQLASAMLAVHDLFAAHARDVLDESDSILDVKYQLVYTVGKQQQLDGRQQRWKIAAAVLRLAQRHLAELASKHPTHLCMEEASNAPSTFRAFRILASDSVATKREGDAEGASHAPVVPLRKPPAANPAYRTLTECIVEDLFAGDAPELRMPDLRDPCVREQLRAFLLHQDCPGEIVRAVHAQYHDHMLELELLLILRGLLGCEVLLAGLSKRWRVQYGVAPDGERLMAVPFRAKDCAAERTEFGHCDVAILLTYLAYYQSGLSNKQIRETIERLRRFTNRDQIYDSWIAEREPVGAEFDGIRSLIGINLLDSPWCISCCHATRPSSISGWSNVCSLTRPKRSLTACHRAHEICRDRRRMRQSDSAERTILSCCCRYTFSSAICHRCSRPTRK